MRFGWLAAAAAMVCAGSAGAQSLPAGAFTEYQVSGTGYSQTSNGMGGYVTSVPLYFSATFDILTATGQFLDSDHIYFGFGSSFNAQPRGGQYGDTVSGGGGVGTLNYRYFYSSPLGGEGSQLSLSYSGAAGFPTAPASYAATGSFSFDGQLPFVPVETHFLGTINNFSILGTFDTFSGLNFLTSAVPEPATWLMLILGFGMVGHRLRRRRERQDDATDTAGRAEAAAR